MHDRFIIILNTKTVDVSCFVEIVFSSWNIIEKKQKFIFQKFQKFCENWKSRLNLKYLKTDQYRFNVNISLSSTIYYTWSDVIPVDSHIFISVGSTLFMIESDSVKKFVNNGSSVNATISQRHSLSTSSSSNHWPTSKTILNEM